MPQTDPKLNLFEIATIKVIETGYLVEVKTSNNEMIHAFKSYRQVLRYIKTLVKVTHE
jgi:hypothetical protein